jgi:hypothetical protein
LCLVLVVGMEQRLSPFETPPASQPYTSAIETDANFAGNGVRI